MAIDDDAPEHQLSTAPGSGDLDQEGCPEEDSVPTAARAAIPGRAAMLVGLAIVVALAGLGGWWGIRSYQAHQAELQRGILLQAARQGAVNLTTIDYEQAESDVQRVLDSATGNFYDDFSRRSQPFIEVVKAAQAKSVGTVTEAGIEIDGAEETNVLVGVTVKTTNATGADQVPRSWRMRISLTQVESQPKISNVAFVP